MSKKKETLLPALGDSPKEVAGSKSLVPALGDSPKEVAGPKSQVGTNCHGIFDHAEGRSTEN